MKTKLKSNFGLFWSLIKGLPGYDARYKDTIKEGLVLEYTKGKTVSLSLMYSKYPAEYCEMMESLKGDYWQKKERYDSLLDNARKRVIASVCGWIDKCGYDFESRAAKISYAKRIACRAANCDDFNKIPESRLSAIYSLYLKKNEVNTDDVVVSALCRN